MVYLMANLMVYLMACEQFNSLYLLGYGSFAFLLNG